MHFKKLIFLLTVFLAATGTVSSQVSNTQNQACNQEFAILLVEQQVADSKSVEETDKRIKILLRSADFLWKFQEETARRYFTEAFQVAGDRFKEKGYDDKKLGNGSVSISGEDFRLAVVRAVAKKDSEWAKRLSEQILQDFEKSLGDKKADYEISRDISNLLQVAKENFKTNPGLSQFLFNRLMRYPLGFHWFNGLFSLALENKAATDTLYLQLLQNYQNETPGRLLFLSAYPFASARMLGPYKYRYGLNVPAGLTPNPALQRQFFQTYFRRIATFTSNPDSFNAVPADNYDLPESALMVGSLQDIEPIIMQSFPNLIAGFGVAKSQANGVFNQEAARRLEDNEKGYQNNERSFEELFKEMEKDDAVGKLTDRQIIFLVFSTKKEEEFKILESWIDKIREEKTRVDTTNYYYFKRSEVARKDRRFDDAKKYALKVPEIEFRALLFFELASEQLKDVNEASQVSETLAEVSRMARSSEDSSGKAQVLLGLAYRYEKTNHTVALSELGEAIRVINSVENPDIFTEYIYRQIFGDKFSFVASFTSTGYNMEKTFEEISKKDFELSLANAKNLNDKYFRTLAVLAVAKNCIQNIPKTKQKK